MYETILIPIDLGHPEQGKATFGLAANLLAKKGRVILLHVIEDVPAYIAGQVPGGLLEERERQSRTELEGIAKTSGLHAEAAVVHGHAAQTILSEAEALGADLIVLASHRPGLADYFLGSTAARVVRHAHCSVLVVR